MTQALVMACLEEHGQAFDRLAKLVQFVVQRLEAELKQHQILARVSGRVKTKASLEQKLTMWLTIPEKAKRLQTPRDVFNLVGDLAAVRVMTYVEGDRDRVRNLISECFRSPDGHTNFGTAIKEDSKPIKGNDANFYRATHMQISVRPEDCVGIYDNLGRDHCELQITSMLAHVWNEIEHDIGYKGQGAGLSKVEQNALESLGLLTKAGDNIIATLIDGHKARQSADVQKIEKAAEFFQNADDLAEFLTGHFPGKISGKPIDFYANASTLYQSLVYLNAHHPSDVCEIMAPSAMERIVSKTMGSLRSYEGRQQIERPRFDRSSADVALVALFEQFGTELAEQPHKKMGPKPRHLKLALLYQDWAQWETARQKR